MGHGGTMTDKYIFKGFVVYFKNEGFYKDTSDLGIYKYVKNISKAKVYKTLKGASLLVNESSRKRDYSNYQLSLGDDYFYKRGDSFIKDAVIYKVGGLTQQVSPCDVRSELEKKVERDKLEPEFLETLLVNHLGAR